MDRRNFATQLAAAVSGVALSGCATSAATGPAGRPTFVFVHGAWHGGWCWSEVVRLLAEQGYSSVALDLPGHGATARFPVSYTHKPQNAAALVTEVSPLAAISRNDYRDHTLKAIRGLVAAGSGPVILVGHSLGGATVSAVAEADPSVLRRMVFLTAGVPVAFPSALELMQQPENAASEISSLLVGDPAAVAALRLNPDSADAAYVAKVKSCFYHDVSDAAFTAIANLLTPDEPISGFASPVNVTAARWGAVPRAFIRCTPDRAITVGAQDRWIAQADALMPTNRFLQRSLPTSHSPFFSAPADLVSALVSLT
ncbi:alpha/beta hydrolase [Comamonas sp. MYb396]|uniref:alpha/beta hydrolase n=1 Tax=Comamonas sp. MYb396 TaxID=2745302 RepID=UPI0030A882C8